MKTIQITILAEDIRTTHYTNSQDCAITRALKRANISAHEGGGDIYHDYNAFDQIVTPDSLDLKVRSMYKSKNPDLWIGPEDSLLPIVEPEDFTYDLEIPDNWID